MKQNKIERMKVVFYFREHNSLIWLVCSLRDVRRRAFFFLSIETGELDMKIPFNVKLERGGISICVWVKQI